MNKTELQKDTLQIAQMVSETGIEERVFNAQTSWYDWSREKVIMEKINVYFPGFTGFKIRSLTLH